MRAAPPVAKDGPRVNEDIRTREVHLIDKDGGNRGTVPIAEALAQELAPFGIKVQTINPGAYLTGYNETMADTAFRWLDDSKNFTKRDVLRKTFDDLLATPEGHLDPKEMIDRMIEIVPADTGKFRNVVPHSVEEMLKQVQVSAWDNEI